MDDGIIDVIPGGIDLGGIGFTTACCCVTLLPDSQEQIWLGHASWLPKRLIQVKSAQVQFRLGQIAAACA